MGTTAVVTPQEALVCLGHVFFVRGASFAD
jgi:hypothetical protein